MLHGALLIALSTTASPTPLTYLAACDGSRAWLIGAFVGDTLQPLTYEVQRRAAPEDKLDFVVKNLGGLQWWSSTGVELGHAFPAPRVTRNEGDFNDVRAIELGACNDPEERFASAQTNAVPIRSALDVSQIPAIVTTSKVEGRVHSVGMRSIGGPLSLREAVIVSDADWCGNETVDTATLCALDEDLRALAACTTVWHADHLTPRWMHVAGRTLALIANDGYDVIVHDGASVTQMHFSIYGGVCGC